jgi:hypothetical protein
MIWSTSDGLGVIAFPTREAAVSAYPARQPVRCEFTSGTGFLSVDPRGVGDSCTIKAPDGREFPVVCGEDESGLIVGLRGGTPRTDRRAIRGKASRWTVDEVAA